MNEQLYHDLRKAIDRMPVGFPATPDGREIEILKKVFTPEEASVAVHLSILPEKARAIHRRMKKAGISITPEKLQSLLDSMHRKGTLMAGAMNPKPGRYSLAQFVIGIYEFQVDQQTREFAADMEDYAEHILPNEIFRHRPYQMRTIPVRESLSSDSRVAPYSDAVAIVSAAEEPVVIIDCVCRQSKDLLADPCRMSSVRNTCVMFGSAARYHLELETPSARRITKEELKENLVLFAKEGFVFQPGNTRNPGFICICCGCCCHMLRSYKRLPRPADYYTTSYLARIDDSLCTGCSLCLRRCQMDAIVIENKKARVLEERCIGCGNCVIACKPGAAVMKKKKKLPFIPRSATELYGRILAKKIGPAGMAALFWRILTGGKK